MSCHEGARAPETIAATATAEQPTVVLVGNPNVGKSTLFNTLTGARQRTVNAPGTTVHWEHGRWRVPDARRDGQVRDIQLIDLPGAHSLLAASPDEQVACDAVAGTGAMTRRPDLAVVVADATALSRSLYILAQVAALGVPVVVALTMADVASSRRLDIDGDRLAEVLGVPVVTVDPRARRGAKALADVVDRALIDRPCLVLPEESGGCGCGCGCGGGCGDGGCGGATDGAPVGPTDRLRAGAEAHFEWVAGVERQLERTADHAETRSDVVDRALLNPWFGILLFLGVMWLVFQLTTTVAAPLQDWIDVAMTDGVGGALTWFLGLIQLDETWIAGFLNDGILAGITTVATFIPPMGIMFLALAVLEDSGYMARAAFVADRLMRALGLDGRAFLPLLVGFGCNLPAIAATRTLPNARQRLLTGLLIPFSSCAARLIVFIVMATVFFPDHAGTAIFLMYLASVLLIIVGGVLLRRTVFRDLKPEPFVLNLPAYQRPRLAPIGSSVYLRLRDFVVGAGKVIVATLAVVWLLVAIPLAGAPFGDTPIEDSLYGRTTEAIAPVFTPAGFGDWHASAALATGFVAKEVVVGAMAQSYAVEEPETPNAPGDLGRKLNASFTASSGGHASAAAAAFMLFVLAYTPCAATVAEQRRNFGWKPALLAVAASLTLAWVLAVAVFQIGRLL